MGHLLLVCQRKMQKIPKFTYIDEYWSQQELSDSLLLELMNPQKHIIVILPEDQPYRKRYSANKLHT